MTTHFTLPDADDFARMETELFQRLETSSTRKVRTHRLVAAASIVLLAGGGVAAATVVDHRTESHVAYCYGSASTSTDPVQTVTPDRRQSGVAAHGASTNTFSPAVTNCEAIFKSGYFVNGPDIKPGDTFTVPDLQACVRNDLVIAVFPRNDNETSAADFCSALGLSAPPSRK